MNSFFTGQVVVCINPCEYWEHFGDRRYMGPKMNEMCVIRGIDSTGKGLLVVGHNTNTVYPQDWTEVGYHYIGFRPLVQYNNDISIFKALLAPGKQELAKEARPLPVPHTSQP